LLLVQNQQATGNWQLATQVKMKIEIITPDRKVYEGEIKSVRVPGKKGSFQVLKDHAPIISTLEEGSVIIIDQDNNKAIFEINGGVIEVKTNKIILLAESVK
jgi:F-type H+-transporting ATPase subunit epsilon